MDRKLWRSRIASVRRSRPPGGVAEIVSDIRRDFGFKHVVYHASNLRNLTAQAPYVKLTYSHEWLSKYLSRDYISIDPVIAAVSVTEGLLNWDALDWTPEKVQAFKQESEKCGVGRTGASVPIRGPLGEAAIFSVTSDLPAPEWRCFLHEAERDLETLAGAVHEKVFEIEDVETRASDKALSNREIAVLQSIALGKTGDEAAEELGITERTVRAHVEMARKKLGATNRVHVISRAIGLGLIDAQD